MKNVRSGKSSSSIVAWGPGGMGRWGKALKEYKDWRRRIERSVRYYCRRKYPQAGWLRRMLLEDAIRRDVGKIEKAIYLKMKKRNPWWNDPYMLRAR